MSSQIDLGKGSKRRVRRIRWTLSERLSIALLLLIAAIFSIIAAVWFNIHDVN